MKHFYSDFSNQSLQSEVSVPVEDFDRLKNLPFDSSVQKVFALGFGKSMFICVRLYSDLNTTSIIFRIVSKFLLFGLRLIYKIEEICGGLFKILAKDNICSQKEGHQKKDVYFSFVGGNKYLSWKAKLVMRKWECLNTIIQIWNDDFI